MHPGSLYRLEVQAITEDGDGPPTSRTFQTPAHQSIPKHSEKSITNKIRCWFHVSLKHRCFIVIPFVRHVVFINIVGSSVKPCFVFKIFILCCCPLIQGPGWGSYTTSSQSSRGNDCCRPIRIRACRVSSLGCLGIWDWRCHSVRGHVRSAGWQVTEKTGFWTDINQTKTKEIISDSSVEDLRKPVFTMHAKIHSLRCPKITVKVQIPNHH